MKKFDYTLTTNGCSVMLTVHRFPQELNTKGNLGKFGSFVVASELTTELTEDTIFLMGERMGTGGADFDKRNLHTPSAAQDYYDACKEALEQFARTINGGWKVGYANKN